MNKSIKLLVLVITVMLALIAAGCDWTYLPYWEGDRFEYSTEDFRIESDKEGGLAIVALTAEAKFKRQLTIPCYLQIEGEQKQISKINLSFDKNVYLKKVVVENPNFDLSVLKECKNLVCVQIDSSLINDPDNFLNSFSGLTVYITGEQRDFSSCEFYKNNNVYQENAPTQKISDGSQGHLIQWAIIGLQGILFIILLCCFIFNRVEITSAVEFVLALIALVLGVVYFAVVILIQMFNIVNLSVWLIGLPLVFPLLCTVVADRFYLTNKKLISVLTKGAKIVAYVIVALYFILGGAQSFAVISIISLAILTAALYFTLDFHEELLIAIVSVVALLLASVAPYLLHLLVAFVLADKTAFWLALVALVILGFVIYILWHVGFSCGDIEFSGAGSASDRYSDNGYSSASSASGREVKNEISLDSNNIFDYLFDFTDYKLPYDCRWESRPYISQRGNVIKLSGSIDLGEATEFEAEELKRECNKRIMEQIKARIRAHCERYETDYSGYEIETNITYTYED